MRAARRRAEWRLGRLRVGLLVVAGLAAFWLGAFYLADELAELGFVTLRYGAEMCGCIGAGAAVFGVARGALTVSLVPEKLPPMTLIDYNRGHFLDQDGRRCRLLFRTDDVSLGDPAVTNPAGQIIAMVMNYGAPDHRREYTVSRPHIRFNEAEAALNLPSLPFLGPGLSDMGGILDRLAAANLS